MGVQYSLLLMSFLSILLQPSSNKTLAKPDPECLRTCGNLTVPYPFGMQENCCLNRSYMVSCNATSGSARIRGMTVDVVDISLDGHLRVISPVAGICYSATSVLLSEDPSVNLSRFPISLARNKITTLGCDTRGNIKIGQGYKAGCLTMPGSCNAIIESCSSFIGCCQAPIEPVDLTRFRFNVESNGGNVGKRGFNNCSYTFIVEDGVYNFSLVNIYNMKKQDLESYEMLLDWTVGNKSCQEAQNNTSSYLCKENSKCFDASNGPGYSCTCSVGYWGNPYLENGCLDVNECEDAGLNSCTHLCNNIPGSHTCHCPKGYNGDGRKDGTRCTRNNNVNKLGIYIGISMGVIVTFVTMFLSYCFLKQRHIAKQKEQNFKRNGGKIFENLLSEYEGSTQIVKIFTERELKIATNNFSPDNIVGQGGFGTVYKGILTDNTVVAIKKSKLIDPNQIRQFVNEVVILSQINHPNIVKLVGCCLETDVPLLAYEYIVNETLHHHLHGKSRGSLLTWRLRLNIAIETAGALVYMHSTTKIIHRDIKSSNILLDDDYMVKVSDFGISRSVPKDKMQVSTAVQGTLGYIDPDYFRSGILTEKSDVYSFGVVLVELLTGKKVNSNMETKKNLSLIDIFVLLLDEDHLTDILDDQVKLDCTLDQLNRVALLVKSCVMREGEARPTMQQVKDELLIVYHKSIGLPCITQKSVSFSSLDSSYAAETSSSQILALSPII